jgi:O-antigen ligase
MAWSWFDRAHNIFFDYLVMSGGLGFLSFVGIYVTLAVVFLKHRFRGAGVSQPAPRAAVSKPTKQSDGARYMSDALVVGIIIAYLVQGLVLFDVLSIYINSFMVLAFAVARYIRGSRLSNESMV